MRQPKGLMHLRPGVWGPLKAPRSPRILDCQRCILSIFRGYFHINLGSNNKEQVKLLPVYIAKYWHSLSQMENETSRKKHTLRYRNLLRLSDTNWACHFFTVHAVSHHLPAVLRVVKEITEEPNSKTAVDATGLKAQFDLQSSWHCLASSNFSKAASDIFQATNVDFAKAINVSARLKEMHAMMI